MTKSTINVFSLTPATRIWSCQLSQTASVQFNKVYGRHFIFAVTIVQIINKPQTNLTCNTPLSVKSCEESLFAEVMNAACSKFVDGLHEAISFICIWPKGCGYVFFFL